MNFNKLKDGLNLFVIKFSGNVFIKTIAAGMARLLPITLVGSIALLLNSLPIPGYVEWLKATGIYDIIKLAVTMTNDIITIYLVVALSSEMAKNFKKNQISAIFVGLLTFFILTPLTTFSVDDKKTIALTLTNLGSRGMFVGIIATLLATRLYIFLLDYGPKIKLHPSVPPAITDSFEALFPIVGVTVVAILVNTGFSYTNYGDIHSFIYKMLQKPLEGASDSLLTMIIICLLAEGLWWFGIHGSNVTSAVSNTLYMPLAVANSEAMAAGQPLPFTLNTYFMNNYKGPRHFVLAFMLLYIAKSKQLKAIGKVSIVPGFFGISEPMKFGIPMVFNPVLLIPMSLAPVISLIIAYVATIIGFLPKVAITFPFLIPGISGFVISGLPGLIVQIIQMIAVFFLYLPFFKVLDRQKCNEEAIAEAELENEIIEA